MAFINDSVFNSGLSWAQTNGLRIDICTQEPTTVTDATTTLSLGNKVVVTGAPANGVTDGRRVTVPAITGGTVTATGTAVFWALTGNGNLVATGALSASQSVQTGNPFTMDAISITLRDAT